MELQGIIKEIHKEETFGTFTKRTFILTIDKDSKYPQDIIIETHQDNVDILDKVSTGDEVTVKINLRGRLWVNPNGDNKYFNSLVAWNIANANANAKANAKADAPAPAPQEDAFGDLPF